MSSALAWMPTTALRVAALFVVVALVGLVGALWGDRDRAAAQSGGSAGLVAAYGFEEPSGRSVVDSSPAGNDGMLDGASRTGAGRFGRALSFDGVDDLVSVPDAGSLDLDEGMTLEAWVRPRAYEGWQTALVKERPGGLS